MGCGRWDTEKDRSRTPRGLEGCAYPCELDAGEHGLVLAIGQRCALARLAEPPICGVHVLVGDRPLSAETSSEEHVNHLLNRREGNRVAGVENLTHSLAVLAAVDRLALVVGGRRGQRVER